MRQIAALLAISLGLLSCVDREAQLERYDVAYAWCGYTAGAGDWEMIEQGKTLTLEALACLSASIDALYGPQQVWE